MSVEVKPSDEARNLTTTLTADTDLVVPILASETLVVQLFLLLKAASGTPDIKLTLVAPAGATGNFSDVNTNFSEKIALGTPEIYSLGTSSIMVEIIATIFNDVTAGNVTLQWAQNTSNAGNTTVEKGSSMRYEAVA